MFVLPKFCSGWQRGKACSEEVTTDEGIVGSDDDVESEKDIKHNNNKDVIDHDQSESVVQEE